jgi:mannose-6-phosphate isomerase
MTTLYPLAFQPIYKEKIWGGRSLERLFGRQLPPGKPIGESWDLADLEEGVSIVANGPMAGTSLTELTRDRGGQLLGEAHAWPNGRFPLLLKLLDAQDILSLQVHPDEQAVEEIPGAALKTECWYVLESRDGKIYKGVRPGVSPDAFRAAIEQDRAEDVVRPVGVEAGDFHYLPAGTVHALGAGVVVAEVQTPSDTTYRVTDWGRGREIHLERSMQCIRFDRTGDEPPGAGESILLQTPYFVVARRTMIARQSQPLPKGRCAALMVLESDGGLSVEHAGDVEPSVKLDAGQTILLPASLEGAAIGGSTRATWLEITFPEKA